MDRIGIRELRQHASKYLDRVAAGETIEITDRGRPVARLVPVQLSPYEQMLADGRIRPGKGDILAIKPVRLPPGSPSVQEILDEMREDRI